MNEAEALIEATGATFAFHSTPEKCRRFGIWKDEIKDNDLIRAVGALKGAISSLTENDIKTVIIKSDEGSASFVNNDNDFIGLIWQEDISSLMQLKRIDSVIKTLHEKVTEENIPVTEITEKEEVKEQPELDELLPVEKKEKQQVQEEIKKEVIEKTEVVIEEIKKKDIFYSSKCIDIIADILNNYLEDFSDVILDNELSDLDMNPEKTDEFKQGEIDSLIEKLYNSTSLLIGPSSASELKDRILKSVKDFAREV